MSIHRRDAKRDKNEAEIVAALRKAGAQVIHLDQPVDLLVSFRLRNVLLEVKGKAGKLTPLQEEWFRTWEGPAFVVRTPEDALRAIGATR